MEGHIENLIFGNFIVPLHNPYYDSTATRDAKFEEFKQHDDIISLGPGLEIRTNHMMHVSSFGEGGRILHFESKDTEPSKKLISFFASKDQKLSETSPEASKANKKEYRIIKCRDDEFVSPGFIDCHIHAAQYVFAGTATDRSLMGDDGWLMKYTFPTERSMADDMDQTKVIYEKLVRRLLSEGTTTALYFGTLDLEPNQVLCNVISEHGQRALVGKVCMDQNSPDDYCHSTDQNLQDTRRFIDYIKAKDEFSTGLLYPVVTPRFLPSCSGELLTGLGEIAMEHKCHIQSHISESVDEVDFSRELDKENGGRSDTKIFDCHKLLTHKTIMAHGNWVGLKEDCQILRDRGTAIAHCPLSNFFFSGTPFPLVEYLQEGNKVGLGTDVAGGYSPSMLNAMRNSVIMSHALQHCRMYDSSTSPSSPKAPQNDESKAVMDYRHAFYVATLGGAKTLGLDSEIGTFAVGMRFDAVFLRCTVEVGQSSNIDIFHNESKGDMFQKICNLGDSRNVQRVFVQARQVVPR